MYTHSTITQLLSYLSTSRSAYHIRAVDLIYYIKSTTEYHYLESIISHSLTSSSSLSSSVVSDSEAVFERFGVLWRLTGMYLINWKNQIHGGLRLFVLDDKLQPGFIFKVPMLIVLETLRNSDPRMRRIGEGWMRSNLKSYIR